MISVDEQSIEELCPGCDCEIVVVSSADGLEIELSCECGSGVALA